MCRNYTKKKSSLPQFSSKVIVELLRAFPQQRFEHFFPEKIQEFQQEHLPIFNQERNFQNCFKIFSQICFIQNFMQGFLKIAFHSILKFSAEFSCLGSSDIFSKLSSEISTKAFWNYCDDSSRTISDFDFQNVPADVNQNLNYFLFSEDSPNCVPRLNAQKCLQTWLQRIP